MGYRSMPTSHAQATHSMLTEANRSHAASSTKSGHIFRREVRMCSRAFAAESGLSADPLTHGRIVSKTTTSRDQRARAPFTLLQQAAQHTPFRSALFLRVCAQDSRSLIVPLGSSRSVHSFAASHTTYTLALHSVPAVTPRCPPSVLAYTPTPQQS